MTHRNIGKIFGKILALAQKFCTNIQSVSKTLGKEENDRVFHQETKDFS
jgi:hypothetical protein